jgi:hypothetical protein
MIIDLILDRKDGKNRVIKEGKLYITPIYEPKQFYNNVMSYYESMPDIAGPIASALDSGTETEIKDILCSYIIKQEYNAKICQYINSVKWL